jgi:hypothetical protein
MTDAPDTTADDLDTDGDSTGPPLTCDISSFNLAVHDATLTLVSPHTGDHRTLRVRTIRKGKLAGKRVLELLVGPRNTADFIPFAFVSSATDQLGIPYINVWRSFQGTMFGGGSVHDKFARMIRHPADYMARGMTFHVALRCRRCGRLLTHQNSITDGIGPICRDKE